MKKYTLLGLLLSTLALAGPTSGRVLNGTSIKVGPTGGVLTLPNATDTLVGKNTTDILTNKSISASTNTITNVTTSGSLITVTPGSAVCTAATTGQAFLNCLDASINGISPGGGVDLISAQVVGGVKTFTNGIISAVTGNVVGNVTGNLTGAVTGNAATATALAANPTDCAADTYATTIAASGNLTCATVTNAGLAGGIDLTTKVTNSLPAANGGVPSGALMPYAGSSAPSGWLLCDGSAVSRATYAALFAAIGTAYGVGDGATTFNLPDLRGRIVAGRDDMGGAAANRITNGGSGITGTTLGANGGAQNITIASGNLPTHTHGVGTLVNSTSTVSGVAGTNGTSTVSGISGTNSTASVTGITGTNSTSAVTFSNPNLVSYNGSGGSAAAVSLGSNPTVTATAAAQSWTQSGSGTAAAETWAQSGTGTAAAQTWAQSGTGTAAAQTISGSTSNGGFANTAAIVMPPTVIVNYIIKG